MAKESEEQKSILRMLQKERHKKNVILNVFLFIFVFGYLFFLTSNAWYPTHSDLVRPTSLNKENEWNGRTVTLISWDYSEEQQLMEVKIEIQNKSFDGIDQYEYEALDRKKGYFEVKPVLEDKNYVVLHIVGVNRNWTEISLRMEAPGADDESENVSQLKLYTNVDKVKRVDSIQTKSTNQYYADRINEKIDNYKDLISELTEENADYQNKIEQAEEDIAQLESEKEYQTAQEIKETEELISQAKTEIDNMQITIDANQADVEEYQERIRNATEELKQYQ